MTKTWHIITCEYPPQVGGVSDHTRLLAQNLCHAGDEVHVWAPENKNAQTCCKPDVVVHRTLGDFSPKNLERTRDMIAAVPGRYSEVFVQWVPHGYGYHAMNVGFCRWLERLRSGGYTITLMVHEPGLEPHGSFKQRTVATVHRYMVRTLLRAVTRVFIAIPAWEHYLRPLAPSETQFEWLPIPSSVPVSANSQDVLALRGEFKAEFLVGHLGTYGKQGSSLLASVLAEVLTGISNCHVSLLGRGNNQFSEVFLREFPQFTGRVHSSGILSERDLSRHLFACDLMLQPYIDGLSTRRTSLMNALSHGLPVVSNIGHLSETLWNDSGAVCVGPVSSLGERSLALLRDAAARQEIAQRGLALYSSRFAWSRIVAQIRSARTQSLALPSPTLTHRSSLAELHAHSCR